MNLSIIIPAYNEADKIQQDIINAAQFLKEERIEGEIIVVDDGSSDDTGNTAQNVKIPQEIFKEVISYNVNRGKGYAVRSGVKISRGQNVMFADTGGCTPFQCAVEGLKLLQSGRCDIAHGSRKLRESKIVRPAVWSRRFISTAFRIFVRLALDVPHGFTDTQCGFKLYNGRIARELFAECQTDGLPFDIEILLRAHKKNYRVCEFPIEWSSDPDSRVFPVRMSMNVLSELLKIKKVMRKI